jgi:hypothetical protein
MRQRGCRIAVIIPVFQTGDRSSTLRTRTKGYLPNMKVAPSSFLTKFLTTLFIILLAPFGLLFSLARYLKLPAASWFIWLSYPSMRRLVLALRAYGIRLDNRYTRYEGRLLVSPDKFYYLFTSSSAKNEVLALLVEDYIPDLAYVRQCFSQELDANVEKLYELQRTAYSLDLEKRAPVIAATVYKLPQDWPTMSRYAIDFPPFYFGFLASVTPKNPKCFWADQRFERFYD